MFQKISHTHILNDATLEKYHNLSSHSSITEKFLFNSLRIFVVYGVKNISNHYDELYLPFGKF